MTLADILAADDPLGAIALRRRESLARHLLRMPLEQRRAWLADHEKAASAAAAEQLREDMTRVHAQRKAAP